MSGHQRYQDVTDAELARERRYEHRRERAAKVLRKRRLADLRMAEELDSVSGSVADTVYAMSVGDEAYLEAWLGTDGRMAPPQAVWTRVDV
jgi:hypothetical protein